jgi:succinyl-CoA synthetase beta subunit
VNIFGGIMRCDIIANGIVAAAKQVGIKVPLVVRLRGTNDALGREILEQSELRIISASDLGEAAQKAVAAVSQSRRKEGARTQGARAARAVRARRAS